MPTVVVAGAIANKYLNGGAAWTRLSYVLGFMKLGFDTYFVEQIDPGSCTDAAGVQVPFEQSVQRMYFQHVMEQFGLGDASALIYDQGPQTHGLTWAELLGVAEAASLLVNVTGHLTIGTLRDAIRRRVYVDLDPGYTQFWIESGIEGSRLEGHDAYFTVGENIGAPGCPIPTCGLEWLPLRQPVVLEHWPVSTSGDHDRFTTIASWRGPYGRVVHGGRTFGLKAHEFRKYIDIPRLVDANFEIALEIHPGDERDRDSLDAHGWRVVDPRDVVPDPAAFRAYVQASGAEFSVAQGIYTETGSGWFSDRTVRYLASGKPALVQDTGFSRNFPTGVGLCSFRTLEEAVAGARSILSNYAAHARASRALAEEYFDSDKVLRGMLDRAGM